MHRESILLFAIAGFIAGTMLRSFFDIGYAGVFFIAAVSLFFFLFWRLRRKAFFLIIAICILAGGVGVFRFDVKDKGSAGREWQEFVGTNVMIRGTIIDEPDERENYTRLILEAHELFDERTQEWRGVSLEKVVITVSRYPSFSYGDVVEAQGELLKPENFGDSDFDWEAYLAKDEIYLEMFYPHISETGEQGGAAIKRWLFSLKEKYIASISSLLPEPHASFLGGLTVGARRAIPEELLDEFRKVGVIHIVVLSGYNVTIIARALAAVLGLFLPWVFSMLAGIFGIILFAILTGGAAPVVRASIMAIFIYIAQATGRVNRAIIALLIAGVVMVFINPKILRFDASFQLSFVATFGLIYLAPRVEQWLLWVPKRFGLRETATATLSAQIAVTPLILSLMGTFSIAALPVNMLILLSVPYAMFFGFLAGVLGWVSHILAFPFTAISYLILEYELRVVHLFSSIPFAQFVITDFPPIVMLFLYGIIIWGVMRKIKKMDLIDRNKLL